MKEKKLNLKTNLEKTRVKKLQKSTIFSVKSAIRFRGQKIEEPEEKGFEARKNEKGCQRDNPSAFNERGSREWTFPTKKRKRRKQ